MTWKYNIWTRRKQKTYEVLELTAVIYNRLKNNYNHHVVCLRQPVRLQLKYHHFFILCLDIWVEWSDLTNESLNRFYEATVTLIAFHHIVISFPLSPKIHFCQIEKNSLKAFLRYHITRTGWAYKTPGEMISRITFNLFGQSNMLE